MNGDVIWPKEEVISRKRKYSQISSRRSKTGKIKRKPLKAKAARKTAEYKVEKIIDHGIEGGEHKFYVKWDGWDDDHNTWEPLNNLLNCEELISEFASNQLTQEVLENLCKELGIDESTLTNEVLESFIPSGGFKALPSKCSLQIYLLYLITSPAKEGHTKKMKKGRTCLLKYLLLLKREKQLQKLKDWQDNINKVAIEEAIIKVENEVDLEEPPSGFIYVNDYVPSEGIIIPDDPPIGCDCDKCGFRHKYCCGNQSLFPYVKKGKLNVCKGTPIYECNKRCKCDSDCRNRVVQFGRKIPLSIYRTANGCGWGVKALRKIHRGEFICEYVGEIIKPEEAERRGRIYDAEGRTYLFDLDFNSSDNPYTVDAATYGNISHFINHSCEPNLGVWAVWINCLDPNLPKLALFSLREIEKNEELSFDYMANNNTSNTNTPEKSDTPSRSKLNIAEESSQLSNGQICKCAADKCRRYLF